MSRNHWDLSNGASLVIRCCPRSGKWAVDVSSRSEDSWGCICDSLSSRLEAERAAFQYLRENGLSLDRGSKA